VKVALLLVFAFAVGAFGAMAKGQDYTPRVLTEAEKVEALKKAYQLNGNSMVGYDRMIDLTDPAVLKADRIVTTVPVIPVPLPKPVDADPDGGVWPKLAEHKSDTCARHGMHRVVTGSSWRCRK
jgi:hypothetical protein